MPPKKQIPLDWLQVRASLFASTFNRLKIFSEEQRAHPAEFVAAYILILHKSFYGHKFQCGTRSCGFENCHEGVIPFSFISDCLGEESSSASFSVMTFFKTKRLRFVSESIQDALVKWFLDEYPIQLRFDAPDCQELLEIQSRAQRVVTCWLQENEIKQKHFDRDPLTFVLHDLEHAHEFFCDQDLLSQQVKIYQHWLNLKAQGLLNDFLENDSHFVAAWNYLISDINSHPAHLQATFREVLRQAYKRKCQLSAEQKLPYEVDLTIDALTRL